MTQQLWRYFAPRGASLSSEQNKGSLLSLRAGDFLACIRRKSSATFVALALALSLVAIGAVQVAAEPPQEKPQEKEKKTANQAQTVATTGLPTEVERESWRQTILHTPRPKSTGCFTAAFPQTEWREVECKTPPHKLYPPRRSGMTRTEIVGGAGPDFSVLVTGHITEAEGSFDSVSGVTSECAVQCPGQVCPANPSCTGQPANEYSLQLNSKPFNTQTCNGSNPVATWTPPTCQGWEQFVYSSTGGGFIQYWLENYGPPGTLCPTPRHAGCAVGASYNDGWCPFQFTPADPVYCVVNAPGSAPAPSEPATNLGNLKLTGDAAGVVGANDAIAVTVTGSAPYTAFGGNYFPDLGTQWQEVEFNVFGDGNGDQAVFNSGSTVAVRTAVASGTSLGPSCDEQSFTGESNNLTLVNTPPPAVKGTLPALLFSESFPAPAGGAATCADATSVGDTHVTTFDGVYYDFQASGDYLLAQDGPDFIVQARQASGAPTWPNAAVNKAVATQMGATRVIVYIEPTRLVIDGAAADLADGKSILLPTGVQVSRQGNIYIISSVSQDRVRATLNSTWINVTVGLGTTPRPQVRGLLGNPLGTGLDLFTSNGVALTVPVLFRDLYHTYAESWRVLPRESLFNEETTIKFGIPSKPFYAANLTAKQSAHALAICKAAGVKNSDLLDSCILDTAVLNDAAAAKVFVHLPAPHTVIQPGNPHKGHGHDKDCDCDHDHDRDRDHDHDKDHDHDSDHH